MKTNPIASDKRYTVTREFTGHASGKPRFVLRFCGERIEDFSTYPAAVLRAAGESAIRRGESPIVGIPAPVHFVVMDSSPSARFPYVAARPGFYRAKDGKQIRDRSCPLTSGPEMTDNSKHALRFKSHRAAARVASRLASPQIVTV